MTFEYTQYIIINSDVKEIKKGKLVAQGAHASIGAYRKAIKESPEITDGWFDEGQRKITLKASEAEILSLNEKIANNTHTYIVRDFGLTQIAPDTLTAMAIGPDKIKNIEQYVKDLKLL
jgi:PTH2 family peptidyl-tRNA hydrolase